MEDNERDRYAHGFDAGLIIDGTVQLNDRGQCILIDDDGISFNPHEALKSLTGKKIRLTVVSFEAMSTMSKILEASGTKIVS